MGPKDSAGLPERVEDEIPPLPNQGQQLAQTSALQRRDAVVSRRSSLPVREDAVPA